MIRTVVVPQNNQLFVAIPNSYIGKEVEVFLYAKEELTGEPVEVKPLEKVSMAHFRGMLTAEETDQLQDYVTKSRLEWERDI
jgi:hypothetical protein